MRWLAMLALATMPAATLAQQLVTSQAPESVSVTVYRNPERSIDDAIDLDWLEGYALITETRTVDLPAGESELRFEGVAGTIIPSSVIIRGLPGMPAEKNYDARLLSPGALIEGALGRQVHIRRTSRATGKVMEEEAIIRSGPDGVLLQTVAGFEALKCTGLPESLVYSEVPPGLSAKPTLSVRAAAALHARVTLSLSYLAGQFDWQANYVARLGADGKTLDLFAWLTLANGNAESFPAVQVNAIAGEPNRDEDRSDDDAAGTYAPEVRLQCWPAGRTSDPVWPVVPSTSVDSFNSLPAIYSDGQDIVVTGSRIRRENLESAMPVTAISAEQEDLGDLKLYRIPEPVTVAANGQKQVAMLHKSRVQVEQLYSAVLEATGDDREWAPAELMLQTRNSKDKGLGLPLPSGAVAVFEQAGGESLLAGQTAIDDLAIDEDVELVFGQSPDVQYMQKRISSRRDDDDGEDRSRRVRYQVEVTNAKRQLARVEIGLRLFGDWTIRDSSARLQIVHGRKTWVTDVPANGRAKLTYTLGRPKPRKIKNSEED